MTSETLTIETGPATPSSFAAAVLRTALIHGTRSLPLGLLAGAILGWAGARSEDAALDTRASIELTALLVGFLFVPPAAASLRTVRMLNVVAVGRFKLVLGGAALGAVVAFAWAVLGAFLAYFVGQLWDIDLVLRPILLLGAGYGLTCGVAIGLLVSLVRALR